ncbi:MAG TPA: TIGR04222 domain-containing membrane protein [Nocardioidaceae bacterium]|nr:TIGR04222 domain-containing membrane protein [Nocardioidaceae bacterium]
MIGTEVTSMLSTNTAVLVMFVALLTVGAVGILAAVFVVSKKAILDRTFLPDPGPVVDVYLLAALNGGGTHVLEVAVAKLVLDGLVRVAPDHALTATDTTGLSGIEAAVLDQLGVGPRIEFGDLPPRLVESPALAEIHKALLERRLINKPPQALNVRLRTSRGTRALAYARRRGPENLLDQAGRPVDLAVAVIALGASADLQDAVFAEAIFGNYWRSEAGFEPYGDWGWPYGSPVQLPGTHISMGGMGGG